MPTCEICSEKLAGSKEGYKAHMKRFHALKSNAGHIVEPSRIVPMRLTTRTKAQIVHDMEKTWGMAVIPEVKPWHSLGER